MNALQPAMLKNRMFVVPECLEQTREEKTTAKGSVLLYSIVRIKYTFFAEDGTSIQAIIIGEAMDSGDKATNKAMAIAFKYACFQVFCIPTKEMVDPDADVHELKPGERATEELRQPQTQSEISEKQVKRLFAIANAAGIDVGAVKKVLVKDYQKTNVEQLTRSQYDEICDRLQKKQGG